MHELTPIPTNLEKFSHNIFFKCCSQYFPNAISQDMNKSSVEIIWLHQTAVLTLIYCIIMDQTNQSFLVIPYKISLAFWTWDGIFEPFHGFAFIFLKRFLHKDFTQKVTFSVMICLIIFSPYSAESFMLRDFVFMTKFLWVAWWHQIIHVFSVHFNWSTQDICQD